MKPTQILFGYIEREIPGEFLVILTLDGERILIATPGVQHKVPIDAAGSKGKLDGPYRFFVDHDVSAFIQVQLSSALGFSMQRSGCVPAGGTNPKYFDDGSTVRKSMDDPIVGQRPCPPTAGSDFKYYDDGGTLPKSYDDPIVGQVPCPPAARSDQKYYDDGGTLPKSYDDPIA